MTQVCRENEMARLQLGISELESIQHALEADAIAGQDFDRRLKSVVININLLRRCLQEKSGRVVLGF